MMSSSSSSMSSPEKNTSKQDKECVVKEEEEEEERDEEESIDQILLRYANEFNKTKATISTFATPISTTPVTNALIKPSKIFYIYLG